MLIVFHSTLQMLTALVLQLIQCVVVLPRRLGVPPGVRKESSPEAEPEVDRDVLINDKYQMAMATALQFLTVFLKKCGSKNEDIDYRPLFENFVQDLLTTVNVPEWPGAELLLSLLGRVLKDQFTKKSTEMALRISSLEYLGVVAARLRKDAVQSKMKVDYIDSIVKIIKEEEEKDKLDGYGCDDGGGADMDGDDAEMLSEKNGSAKKKKKKKGKGSSNNVNGLEEDPEEERNRFLQVRLMLKSYMS